MWNLYFQTDHRRNHCVLTVTRMVTKHAARTCAEAANDGVSASTARTGNGATKGRIALAAGRVCAAAVVAILMAAESPNTIACAALAPLDTATFIANADGINERIPTRVLLRVRERVCEQHDGKRDLRPGVPVIHDNTLAAVNASYPILLVPAADSKVPPPTGGVALATGADLPSNLVAPQVLERLMSRMWKQSRTFRRQCARINAEPGLLVRVLTAATVSQSGGRAATHIQRGATGLEAVVNIASRAAPSDFIELIAHEFEHIIEQLDGLDLARLARLAPVTVWATGTQRFETERATHMGRLVAAEVEGRAR